jgi:lysophospholipase L1-like esterase
MMNQRSIWIFRCLLITASLLGLAVCAESTTDPVPREDDWWQQRNAAVNARVKEGNVDLICIGDSITHGWDGAGLAEWERLYAKRNAVNMGFSGDRTQHVLWRLENGHLEGIHPKLAVIMIGTNNHANNTAEEIATGVKAIVAKLRTTLPDTRILLLAIFPRTDVSKEIQDKLAEASRLFAVAAEDPMVEFLDINRVFLNPKGELTKDVMPDFLHPNELGYALWAHALEPTIARLMGEEGMSDLFNGKDLIGWEQVGGAKQTWGVENGQLYTDGDGGGWLSTTREFGNFELELEFNVPAGGNSGVFVRAPRQGNPAFEGLEIQVLDDAAPEYAELKPWQFCGSVYSTIAPSSRVSKPAGEWQKMSIRYEGFNIRVTLNGVEIINANISDFKDKAVDHPGVLRTAGFIGLQNHGSRLDYRNIRLRELP